MRDMLDGGEPYPLTAWSAQFERIRTDLDDALKRQGEVALAQQTPEQRQYLASQLAQFWDAADRIFELARTRARERGPRADPAVAPGAAGRAQHRRGAPAGAEQRAEEQTAQQVQDIYGRVQRQVYWFLAATLAAIVATSLYLIRSNRRLFARLASLSDERRELAQKLIATRESTLREISRELHDEFGQILTAIGSMLGRAGKHAPEGSPLRADLREIGEVAQTALDNVRGLSQTLHPSILEELGLESTVDWYLSTVERQLGITVSYERAGTAAPVDATIGIHVYRVLQEALSNVARHSGADRASVRLRFEPGTLELDVEDHGKGLSADASRDGAASAWWPCASAPSCVGGTIAFLTPASGGTLVRLTVPLQIAEAEPPRCTCDERGLPPARTRSV